MSKQREAKRSVRGKQSVGESETCIYNEAQLRTSIKSEMDSRHQQTGHQRHQTKVIATEWGNRLTSISSTKRQGKRRKHFDSSSFTQLQNRVREFNANSYDDTPTQYIFRDGFDLLKMLVGTKKYVEKLEDDRFWQR